MFLKRTIDLLGMAVAAAQPDVMPQIQKARDLVKENVWIGASLSSNNSRLEESYFCASTVEVEDHVEYAGVKEALKKLFALAPADSVLLTGIIPFSFGEPAAPGAAKKSDDEIVKKLHDKIVDYKNLSKLLENGFPEILNGRKSVFSVAMPDGDPLPMLDLCDDPSRAQTLADGLAAIAEAGARDYAENLKKKGKLPKEITPEMLAQKNFAVEKIEKNGQTFYLDSANKLLEIPGQETLRPGWTAYKSHLIFGSSLEILEKRSRTLDAGSPGFDASAILESDLDAHPLPVATIIDTHTLLGGWFKRVLPGLIEHAASEPDLQNALREAGKIDDPFKTLPPISITVSRPSRSAFECKIRSPLPFFPMLTAVAAITAFSVKPVEPEKAKVEVEGQPDNGH